MSFVRSNPSTFTYGDYCRWPDEVLSPSTALKDMDIKRSLYQSHGVREYWLVHPTEHWGMIYLLDQQGRYEQARMFGLEAGTRVAIFPDLLVDWEFLTMNKNRKGSG